MVSSNVVAAQHWRHYDHAQIPQFHGSRVLHGFRSGIVANVLPALSNVSYDSCCVWFDVVWC